MLVALLCAVALAGPGWVDRGISEVESLIDRGDWAAGEERAAGLVARIEKRLGGDDAALSQPLSLLASVKALRGRPGEAVPLATRAVAITEAAAPDDHAALARLYQNQGSVMYQNGDLLAASRALEKALELAERHQADSVRLAGILANASLVALNLGQQDLAERHMRRALSVQLAVSEPDDPTLGKAHGNLSYVLTYVGYRDEAAEHARQAHAIFEAAYGPDHPLTVQSLYNLATAAHALGDYQSAGEEYQKLLPRMVAAKGADHADVAALRASLGVALALSGRPDEAIAQLEQADDQLQRTVGPKHIYVDSVLPRLISLYRTTGRHDQARAVIDRWMSWGNDRLAIRLKGTSERERLGALAKQRVAFGTWLSMEEDEVVAYEGLTAWKGATRRVGDLERVRARGQADADLRALYGALEATRAELAQAVYRGADDATVAALEIRRDREERALAERAGGSVDDVRPIDLAEVCAAMPPGSAFVDYATYWRLLPSQELDTHDWGLAAFVVRQEGCSLQRIELGGLVDIVGDIGAWWKRLGSHETSELRTGQPARRVRRAIFDPLGLDEVEHIIVSPDAQLQLVPFAALPSDDGGYAVERHLFSYVDSAHELVAMGHRPSAPLAHAGAISSVVVGGVEFGGASTSSSAGLLAMRSGCDGLPAPLPESEREARQVAGVLRALDHDVTLLSGTRATELAVRNAVTGARVVHLATHGFHDGMQCNRPVRPDNVADMVLQTSPLLRSGVLLASGSGVGSDDGLWTAEEVSALDLSSTELVVLSACETGLGKNESGEGVLGLRRALGLAGARTLVSALWKVEDQATADLMARLYEHLAEGESAAQALRLAQLDLLRGDRGPRSWAAFLAAGGW